MWQRPVSFIFYEKQQFNETVDLFDYYLFDLFRLNVIGEMAS